MDPGTPTRVTGRSAHRRHTSALHVGNSARRPDARTGGRSHHPPPPAHHVSCACRARFAPCYALTPPARHVQRDKYPAPHRLGTRSHRLHVWRRPAEASTSASTSASGIVITVSRLGMLSRYDGVMWYTKWLARNHSPSAPSGALTSPSVLSHPGSEHTAPRTPAIPTTFPAAAPQKISLRTGAVAICGAREASVNINKEVD